MEQKKRTGGFGKDFSLVIIGQIISLFGNQILRYALPLWMVQNASQSEFKFWSFTLYCIAFSFLLATTTKITKSVFSAILLHAWGNTMCGGVFTCGIMTDGPHTRTFAAFAIMIVLSTIGYYIVDRTMDKPN